MFSCIGLSESVKDGLENYFSIDFGVIFSYESVKKYAFCGGGDKIDGKIYKFVV